MMNVSIYIINFLNPNKPTDEQIIQHFNRYEYGFRALKKRGIYKIRNYNVQWKFITKLPFFRSFERRWCL